MEKKSIPDYYQYWGKARKRDDETYDYHLLVYHCLDVAAVGRVIITSDFFLQQKLIKLTRLSYDALIKVIPFFLSIHDVGKFSMTFQSLEPALMEFLSGATTVKAYSKRHDILSRVAWKKIVWPVLKNMWNITDDYFAEALSHLADTVCGHHGKPVSDIDGLNPIPVDCFFGEDDKNAIISFIRECISLFSIRTIAQVQENKDFELAIKYSSWPIAGLAVIADWIGSNSENFKLIYSTITSEQLEPVPLESYWNKYALPKAEEAVSQSGLKPCLPSPKTDYKVLFPKIIVPSELQTTTDNIEITGEPSLFIIEDTTGSGKTEAALMLAHRIILAGQADGIYFALPTMATADAVYKRISEMYLKLFAPDEKPSLILAHSSRLLSKPFMESVSKSVQSETSDDEGEGTTAAVCNSWLADSAKKVMLANVGVGTIDQAISGILRARHQSLKIFGLFRKVIIIDEVHAYDSYVEGLLETLLKFHYALGSSVVLLSATLTQKSKEKYLSIYSNGRQVNANWKEYPLLTICSKDKEPEKRLAKTRKELQRQIKVQFSETIGEAATFILESAKNGKCCCWIRNTVNDALEAYNLLRNDHTKENVILLHARFAMCDRRTIEDSAIDSFGPKSAHEIRKGKIIIATQVIEQSLDLDFDEMVTDIAPIDLIIQRAGRLRRHVRDEQGNPKPPTNGQDERGEVILHILAPMFERYPKPDWLKKCMPGTSAIYEDHAQVWKTQKIILDSQMKFKRDEIGWMQPADFRKLIEYVYSDEDIPPKLQHRHDTAQGNSHAAHGLSLLNSLNVNWGYTFRDGVWDEDINLPTRIGMMTTKVILCKWINSKLEFWSEAPIYPAELSTVIVNEYWVKTEAEYAEIPQEIIQMFKIELPYEGKGIVLLPLLKRNGRWTGKAINKNGQEMEFYYSSVIGLTWNKGDDDAVQPDS